MLIATVIAAIVGAVFGTQAGGGAPQTPAQALRALDDDWKAFNEEVGKWYAKERPKLMEAFDVEDERTKAVRGAARVVSP